jgi:glycosyltransferase involved in cell wall biosynthesis
MEALGVSVNRFALRSDENLVDEEDRAEARQTRLILKAGALEFFRSFVAMTLTRPLTVVSVIGKALQMGWRSESGLVRHLAYVLEAALLASWCRKCGVEHIHAHFGTNSTTIVMFASRFSGIPYSFTAHGSEEFIKAPLLSLHEKLEHATNGVCVSFFGQSQLMRWSSPDHWSKISVVHCGLDAAFFDGQVGPPPSAPRLVCVGRFDENKGQLILVSAMRRLKEEGIRCELVLVGDGPMRNGVEVAIREAGLQDTITLTGRLSGDRVKAEIEAARALVLPSFCENMPVVIMEALARARPIISTYVGGIPELVANGKTGWLVPAGDELALAQAMQEALSASVSQLQEMGAAGRRHVREQHDVHKEALKLKGLFERSVDGGGRDQGLRQKSMLTNLISDS